MAHRSKDKTQGPARHGTQAPPGQEPRDTGTENTTTTNKVIHLETGKPWHTHLSHSKQKASSIATLQYVHRSKIQASVSTCTVTVYIHPRRSEGVRQPSLTATAIGVATQVIDQASFTSSSSKPHAAVDLRCTNGISKLPLASAGACIPDLAYGTSAYSSHSSGGGSKSRRWFHIIGCSATITIVDKSSYFFFDGARN